MRDFNNFVKYITSECPAFDTVSDGDLELHLILAAARFAGNRKFHKGNHRKGNDALIMDFAVDYLATLYLYLNRKGRLFVHNPQLRSGDYDKSAVGLVDATVKIVKNKGEAKENVVKAVKHLQVLLNHHELYFSDCWCPGNFNRLHSINHWLVNSTLK